MALFDNEDYLVSDSAAAPPASPLIMPGEPGIGLSPAIDPRSAAVGRMSTPQKMFSALGEVGAALQGRPSPLDAQVRQERSDKLQKLQETKIHNDLLEDSVKLLKQMHGPERQAFARARAAQLNGISPGLGDSLVGLSEQPDILKRLGKLQDIPAVQMAASVGGAAAVEQLTRSPNFWKGVVQPHFDEQATPLIMRKVKSLTDQFKLQNPERYAEIQKNGITHSEVMEMNDAFAGRQDKFAQMALTDDEKQTLSRKEKFVYGALGIIGSEAERKADEQRLIDAGKKAPATEVARLNAELERGDITPEQHKARMGKLTKEGSGVTINMPGSSDTVQGEDGKFYKFRIGKDGKVDAVPMQTPSGDPLRPPKPAGEARADRERAEGEATVSSVRKRIETMSAQLQGNTGIVGPAGLARRVGETVGGVVSPGMGTPAIDYQNNMRLLLSDVRKIVEKDPNLSKDERESLYETLGGGITQTPGSAIRTLNNVMEYVEGKAATGGGRKATIEGAVKGAGWDYEPGKYEYRIVDGKVQRKAKGK